jgi:hypothetical protein
MSDQGFTIADQFVGKDATVRQMYDRLIEQARTFGAVCEEPKKTCIHLANGTAFAGVHTRKSAILLTIRTDFPIDSPRIAKSEKVSKSRYHHDIRLDSIDQIDGELIGWLRSAYCMSSGQTAAVRNE